MGTTGGVAGTGFEAYARIPHPVDSQRLDLTVIGDWRAHPTLEKRSWRWAEVAARTGHAMHPLVQWRRLTDGQDILTLPDGWSFGQSSDGWFDPTLLAALVPHLRAATSAPREIVVGIWNGWNKTGGEAYSACVAADTEAGVEEELARLQLEADRRQAELAASTAAFDEAVHNNAVLKLPGRDFVLLRATLDELEDPAWGYTAGIGWSEDDNHPTPQLIWPDDHAWCVATAIDWDFTLIAGTRQLVDTVLADDGFESVEVREGDDLSWDGDTINPKRTD